jgi:hypothetical protein
MALLSIDILCAQCGLSSALVVEREEKDDSWECPDCGGEMKRAFLTPPAIMQRSFPDGTKRTGFQDLKEALRLESEAYDMPVNRRAEIGREIKKLRAVKK